MYSVPVQCTVYPHLYLPLPATIPVQVAGEDSGDQFTEIVELLGEPEFGQLEEMGVEVSAAQQPPPTNCWLEGKKNLPTISFL